MPRIDPRSWVLNDCLIGASDYFDPRNSKVCLLHKARMKVSNIKANPASRLASDRHKGYHKQDQVWTDSGPERIASLALTWRPTLAIHYIAPRVQNAYFWTAKNLIDAEGHTDSYRQKIFEYPPHAFQTICCLPHYSCVGLQGAQAERKVKGHTKTFDWFGYWFMETSTAAIQVSEVQHISTTLSIALVSYFETRSSTPCKIKIWQQRLRNINFSICILYFQSPSRQIKEFEASQLSYHSIYTVKPSR